MSMVVLEIKDKHAAVLKDDGSIHKIFNDNYNVGQVIGDVVVNKPDFKWVKSVSSIAAAFAMVFTLSMVVIKTPTTFVSIDVNPSIEYECNIFNRVVKVSAKNDQGEDIIQNVKLKNLEINEAINKTVTELANEGYLVDGQNGDIVVSCASVIKNSSDKTLSEVTQIATASANLNGVAANVMAINSTMGERKQAQALNTTAGKLSLVEQYNTVANDSNISSTVKMLKQPVSVIMMNISDEKQKQQQAQATSFSEQGLTKDATQTDDDTVKEPDVKDDVNSDVNSDVNNSDNADKKEAEGKEGRQGADKVKKEDGLQNKTPSNEPKQPDRLEPKNSDAGTPPKNDADKKTDDKKDQPETTPIPNDEPKDNQDNKQEAPIFGLDDEIEDSLQA